MAGAPAGNTSFVEGESGAVEANATVRITNITASARTGATVSVTTSATPSGSFSRAISETRFGDRLEIQAIDAAGNESPVTTITAGPELTSLTLRVVGDEPQTGVAGQRLPDPLQVQVTAPPPHDEIRQVAVLFEVRSGDGTLTRTRGITGTSGIATTELTLGGEGTHEVVARLEIDPANEIVLEAEAVGAPRIDSVSPAQAQPGQTVTIRGANFSPIARHNEVTFGDESADVTEATSTRLVVEVPLFALDGAVTVTLTGISSNGTAFDVLPVPVNAPPVGSVEIETFAGGDGTIVLPFEDAGTEYVLAVQATSPTSNTFSTRISVRGATVSAAAPSRGLAPAGARGSRIAGESWIRAMERDALRRLPRTARSVTRRQGLEPAQDLGSKRPFFVVNSAGPIAITDPDNFDEVTATLRYKGENTLVYVDDRVPGTRITDAMLTSLGNRFDDQIYPRDVGAFGEPSDEDGNGRVIILLSPTVNSLTTQEIFDQGSRIVGFFFGIDLLFHPSQNPFANDGEVFYSVVPDPDPPVFGAAPIETGEDYVDLVAGVAAHEFQHMISFNWHVCRDTSPCQQLGQQETLWLDEGLSHMAEAINDLHFQNQLRGALFLATPHLTSLVAGGNDLDERGASYLFVQYLVDRFGEDILRDMVVDAGLAGRSGIVNVDHAADTAFTFLFHEWASTLFLDGLGLSNDPVFDLPSRNLRNDFAFGKNVLNSNPDTPDRITTEYLDITERDILGVREQGLTVNQRGTSAAYVRIGSPARIAVPVEIDGAINSELQVTVIRVQ